MILGRDVLLDAGPLISLLNPRDQWHGAIASCWTELVPRCLTTEAVLVEATHIVARGRGTHTAVLELLLAADVPVFALHRMGHEACVHLLRTYADVPMDYADATLVALADRLDLHRVFTLDRRGFRTYRGARGLPLDVVPIPGR